MTGPLHDVRALELGDDGAAYVGKLLVTLGATVTKIDPTPTPDGWLVDPARSVDRFLNRGKERVLIVDDAAAFAAVATLVARHDVIIESGHPHSTSHLLGPDEPSDRPDLIRVRITPFGVDGPKAGWLGSDLVCSAMGGFLGLAGYPDAAPTRAFGDQALRMASLHAAGGLLIALLARDATGRGQLVDVSVQEAVATALENAIQFYDLEGVIRRRTGQGYREAGSGLFAAGDGLVYLMAGRLSTRVGWARLIEWMVETGVEGAEDLTGSEWDDFGFRSQPAAEARFREIFETFATQFRTADLYEQCQERNIVLMPVSTPVDVLKDVHLRARDFFEDTPDGPFPGPPFRIRPIASMLSEAQ